MFSGISYFTRNSQSGFCRAASAFCLITVLGFTVSAAAATHCVNMSGTSGCYSSISAAVAASSPNDTIKVEPGTYKDFVKITIPLSLIGSSRYNTIIDATGQSNAVYVNDGSTIVTDVVIAGFTVENANFEGILVNGASSITIRSNLVVDNDKALQISPTNPVCPNLTTVYPFEGNEQDDCGEGIHLTNVSSSVIAFNTVEHNAGGILVSDDSGPTHDNSIRYNTVSNNVYDCGITMPSHTPFGVYHNTVSNNQIYGNGTDFGNGGGAGVGIFSPGGPTQNYGNAVVNNEIVGNGIAGVAMHTHAPGTEVLQDETIVGNYISRNGYDSDLGLSPGQSDGIAMLLTGGNVSGIVISENTFDDEAEDIVISTDVAVHITATLNNFSRNSIAVDNLGPAPGFAGTPVVTGNATVNAKEDWWGCPGGPGAPGCATISNAISSGTLGSTVLYMPWLTIPVAGPQFASQPTP
jgi:parallel beta-helix repeat protein